jgi:hypothetical protein
MVRFSAGARDFPLHSVKTVSEAYPASYPMGTVGISSGVKRQVHEADHLPSSSAEVKNTWFYLSIPPYAFIAQCVVRLSTGTTLHFYF